VKHDRLSPCKSCPYRKDAKLGFWDKEHFVKLLADDRDPMHGAMYQCHEDGKKPDKDRDFCIGWLLSQQERGTPSIQLRLKLMSDQEACNQYKSITNNGLEMYESIVDMCDSNLEATQDMKSKAKKTRSRTCKSKKDVAR
jgi:hypothetical protein